MRSSRVWMRSSWVWMRSSRVRMRFNREWMRSSRVLMRPSRRWMDCAWMRSSLVWMWSSRVWMRSRTVRMRPSRVWMRSSQVCIIYRSSRVRMRSIRVLMRSKDKIKVVIYSRLATIYIVEKATEGPIFLIIFTTVTYQVRIFWKQGHNSVARGQNIWFIKQSSISDSLVWVILVKICIWLLFLITICFLRRGAGIKITKYKYFCYLGIFIYLVSVVCWVLVGTCERRQRCSTLYNGCTRWNITCYYYYVNFDVKKSDFHRKSKHTVTLTLFVMGWNAWKNHRQNVSWAGIFKKSMGARHWGGIGFSYRPARLHRLAELIPWHQFRGPINI